MRRLGLLVLPILVLVFPAAAGAAWQGPTPWSAPKYIPPDQVSFDRFNTGLRYAEADDMPGAGWLANSLDGGLTWDAAGSLTAGGKNFEVAAAGDGSRIWAYSLSNTIAVTRASPTGGPGEPASTRYFSVPRVTDLEIAVNFAGDALISWSDKYGDPGVSFWEAGDDAPGPIQILPNAYYCGGSSTPTPFLDPSGSATLAWTCDGVGVNQASSDDASVPGGFGGSARLAQGAIIRSGQAPDGRAVILFDRTESIPENTHGLETVKVLKYASRAAGSRFNGAKVLAGGGGDTNFAYAADRIVVSPSGRVLTGFSTRENIPSPNYFCEEDGTSPYKPASFMATGTIDPESGELTLANTGLSSPGLTGAWVTHVAVGTDGRLALAHGGTGFCGMDTRPSAREHVLLSLDGQTFDEIPNPYFGLWSFEVFTFTAKGQLFVTARNALGFTPPQFDLYDTSVPLEPAVHPAPTGSTGGVGAKSVPPAAVDSRIKLVRVKALNRGKLMLTLDANLAGKFRVIAASGGETVAKASAQARAGTTKLQIKLNYKNFKRLKKNGKLKTKLAINFAPSDGSAPASLTKHVTFKK